MDLDEMLHLEEEVSCPWEDEPPEASQLMSDAALFIFEPAAMDVMVKNVTCATTPSKSSSSSCSRADVALVPSPGSSSSSTTASPPKKRRLRVKTNAAHEIFVAPTLLPELGLGELFWDCSEEEFSNKNFRNQYHFVYNRLRKWKTCRGNLEAHEVAPVEQADVDDEMLEELTPHDVAPNIALALFMEQTSAPKWLQTWVEQNMLKGKPQEANKWLHARSVLLTWNGPWGVMLIDPKEVGIDGDVHMLCQRVRDSDLGQKLVQEFFAFIVQLETDHHVCEWAASVELCTRTLETSGVVRLHCHAFLRKASIKFNLRFSDPFQFKSSVPDRRAQHTGCRARGTGSCAALYYLQCPKIGMVATAGSKQPFIDYSVNGSWIFTLVQSLKMGYTTARVELIKTTQGLTRKLADLDKWHAEQGALDIQEQVRARCAALQAVLLPFRVVQIVEDWKVRSACLAMRKRFLVLEGPSGVAKTAYATSLWGSAATLELNMAGSDDFCLRKFNPAIHRAIVWDEARPSVVSSQRKLFQCGPSWVDLGQSPTGAHVYRVWLNDSAMIVCSNKWTELVNDMKHSDAEWIRANQVLVTVSTSLVA
jgi:hypothetical protein